MIRNQHKKNIAHKPSLVIGIISTIAVILLYGTFWWGINHFIQDPQIRGVFGDKFGAINALFSGLAFVGLIVTLLFQREELKLQRVELEQTREELSGQRKEFEVQNKTLKYQQFNSTLYSMLSLQQQIVSDLCFDSDSELYSSTSFFRKPEISFQVKGRDLFRFSFLKQNHQLKVDGVGRQSFPGFSNCLKIIGLESYTKSKAPIFFDHYFRHLLRILKYIDSCEDLSFIEKYQIVSNVRGTMSRYELVWLYYYILANHSHEYKTIVEKYTFFKDLDPDSLSLCLQNKKTLEEKGVDIIEKPSAEITDYYFFMSDEMTDENKYYIGAFYNPTDTEEFDLGHKRYKEWCSLYLKE